MVGISFVVLNIGQFNEVLILCHIEIKFVSCSTRSRRVGPSMSPLCLNAPITVLLNIPFMPSTTCRIRRGQADLANNTALNLFKLQKILTFNALTLFWMTSRIFKHYSGSQIVSSSAKSLKMKQIHQKMSPRSPT